MTITPRQLPFVFRHSQEFSGLPPIYQWEFTRRHPYYVLHWEAGNLCQLLRAQPDEWQKLNHDQRQRLGHGLMMLQYIGAIASHYPDPAIDGRTEPGFSSPFAANPVRPMTVLEHLLLVLYLLPSDVQSAVAAAYLREIANETASDKGQTLLHAVAHSLSSDPPSELEAALRLLKGDGPLWDRLIRSLTEIEAPSLEREIPGMLYVNYQLSADEIANAVRKQVAKWKGEDGVSEKRRQPGQWNKYLEVWDLRKGWGNGTYDGTRELSLKEIAKRLRSPISTVASRYRAAFKLITGRECEMSLWRALISGFKQGKGKRTTWRQPKGTGNDHAVRSLPSSEYATPADETGYVELCMDMRQLIEEGKTDEQIAEVLELSSGPALVAAVREGIDEELI